MVKSDIVVGLDIGTTKICMVLGEATANDGIIIHGIGHSSSTGMRKGMVVSIDNTARDIHHALAEAELMAGREIRSVYVGIAGSHISSFNSEGAVRISGDAVTGRDIERALETAGAKAIPQDREIIHTLPQEYIVDEQGDISDPLGMAGVRLEVKVHIVTGAVASAQNIVRACQRSGLSVEDIVLESLASSKAVLTDEERELGVILVDLGGGTSDIALFVNNAIKHTSVISLGGQYVTKDIAHGLRTPVDRAEELKLKYSCAMVDMVLPDEFIEVPEVGDRSPRRLSRRMLAEICQARMEEILAMVNQDLIKSGYKNQAVAGVVLTGGGSMIAGCQELSEQIFELPARIGYPRNLGGLKNVAASPDCATAVGLLCYGVEKEAAEGRSGRKIDFNNPQKDFSLGEILSRFKKWFTDVR
ncbi:MAG: cell division protein FtsA [Deltaproteobacteria bacterium]|jgi:cell division protein FtsA|nr:cell division protein FtsA [Deltaproteobacteria bacterium]